MGETVDCRGAYGERLRAGGLQQAIVGLPGGGVGGHKIEDGLATARRVDGPLDKQTSLAGTGGTENKGSARFFRR